MPAQLCRMSSNCYQVSAVYFQYFMYCCTYGYLPYLPAEHVCASNECVKVAKLKIYK